LSIPHFAARLPDMRRHQRLALLLGFILVVSACAGKPPARVDSTAELPKELSGDLQTRFEVKEVAPSPSPSPSPSVEPSPEPTPPHHRKKRHHKKAPEPEPSPSPSPSVAFEYPNRRPVNEPIWVGESLTYDVKYFGLRAGEFTLTVLPFKSVDNRKVYHIQGTAKTEALFSASRRATRSSFTILKRRRRFTGTAGIAATPATPKARTSSQSCPSCRTRFRRFTI
jgi:hypothetical protein